MFKVKRPTAGDVETQVAAARLAAVTGPGFLTLPAGVNNRRYPVGLAHDHSRSLLGAGWPVFDAAKQAFRRWTTFDLGWVRVANPDASITIGQVVAVEARTMGLWTLNLSRIVGILEDEWQFGFIYSTTKMHVEQGEERFQVEMDTNSGNVWYEIEALSRPRNALARLGYPVTRAFQHRFARDSHRRMKQSAASPRDE
jgi:uncharacterized protein (UPF0548 family)